SRGNLLPLRFGRTQLAREVLDHIDVAFAIYRHAIRNMQTCNQIFSGLRDAVHHRISAQYSVITATIYIKHITRRRKRNPIGVSDGVIYQGYSAIDSDAINTGFLLPTRRSLTLEIRICEINGSVP